MDRLQRSKENEKYLDKIKGSLMGGAMGDALGYPVEFLKKTQIEKAFGPDGITAYKLDENGKALISDDTQMTLFTANGMLVGDTRLAMRGIGGVPHRYITMSYKDWLCTQEMSQKEFREKRKIGYHCISWLCNVPELFNRRAPGMTCLQAMQKKTQGSIEKPINDSKGCGGIMRVAPIGLHYGNADVRDLDLEGAEVAALTHGHPLGYMSAAVLTHILSRIVYPVQKEDGSIESIWSKVDESVREEMLYEGILEDVKRLYEEEFLKEDRGLKADAATQEDKIIRVEAFLKEGSVCKENQSQKDGKTIEKDGLAQEREPLREAAPRQHGVTLKEIIIEARDTVHALFENIQNNPYIEELDRIINLAIELAENDDADAENIPKLGEGWVAEETLAIAIYCSLRYQNDFSKGIIAAVNHNGDSDSTGAVTGNILGAWLGFEAIENKWKENLECYDVLEEMAVDICHGCPMDEYGTYRDVSWIMKYQDMQWIRKKAKI